MTEEEFWEELEFLNCKLEALITPESFFTHLSQLYREIATIIKYEGNLSAVQAYRYATGVSFGKAYSAINELREKLDAKRDEHIGLSVLDVEIIALIKHDRFAQAVKAHREATGSSLKDSADYVRGLRRRMGGWNG